MRKLFTLVASIVLLSTSATFAQDKIISLSYSMAVPSGNTNAFINDASFRGGTFEYRQFINPQMSLGFSVGYQRFYQSKGYTTVPLPDGDGHLSGQEYSYIDQFPLMATYHYYFGLEGGVRPYAGIGVGAAHYEYTSQIGSIASVGKQWHFNVAPEVGVLVPIGNTTYFHTNIKYNYAAAAGGFDAQSYWGFNIGLAFDL
ncbi:OmpW family outer membrane protein [Flammeovirga agarivorans]|uniref:Outer membrane beta-barrel protein n=1 Tax=Flammeovirga agarivorans TaxID=2726742 RepID=A0A7X8XWS1_9BACT|nr:OmpW family outer membrane protein [Flammeovirga agarivorans]NLR92552.1 outer membrane beta-barrel protein [Flammeovirga agarivorans]